MAAQALIREETISRHARLRFDLPSDTRISLSAFIVHPPHGSVLAWSNDKASCGPTFGIERRANPGNIPAKPNIAWAFLSKLRLLRPRIRPPEFGSVSRRAAGNEELCPWTN